MRLALLELLPQYVDRLEKNVVGDKIWGNFVTGFGDTVPVIREATVKSVLLIAPKLTDRLLNNDLLRHLAKTQMDAEPGIRTNTCILLGRLSKHLSPQTCRKVLIPAFSRALRDPFTPARLAGLMALMATMEVYEKEDLAGKVVPAMGICLVDKEGKVREQAFRALDMFVDKIKKAVADMPESPDPPTISGLNGGSTNPSISTPNAATDSQPGLAMSAAGAAGALAGWAFSSVGKKLTSTDLASSIDSHGLPVSPNPNPNLGASTPASASRAHTPQPAQIAKAFTHQPPAPISRSDSSSSFDVLSNGSHSNSNSRPSDDWGGNLMDVQADADDWTSFETGPPAHDPSFVPLASTFGSNGSPGSGLGKKPKPKPLSRGLGGGGGGGGGSLKLGARQGKSSLAGKTSKPSAASSLVAALEAEAALDDEGAEDTWGVDPSAPAEEDWGQASVVSVPPVPSSPPLPSKPAPTRVEPTPRYEEPPAKPVAAVSTSPAPKPPSSTGDKAAQMAKMKEERRAKMAALKAKKAGA